MEAVKEYLLGDLDKALKDQSELFEAVLKLTEDSMAISCLISEYGMACERVKDLQRETGLTTWEDMMHAIIRWKRCREFLYRSPVSNT